MRSLGAVLREPHVDPESGLSRYSSWLAAERGLVVDSYADLHAWSVEHVEDFWWSVWDHFDIGGPRPRAALTQRVMPGAEWFPGGRVNYAREMLTRAPRTGPCLVAVDESLTPREIDRAALVADVAALVATLRRLGVRPGDRVAAFMPNIPETVVAMLATAAIGAVWTACAPDFGTQAVVDRFAQTEPTVLIAVAGYRFGGSWHDRRDVIALLRERLTSVAHTIVLGDGGAGDSTWDEALARDEDAGLSDIGFADVEFAHPLWILFSSGTTGRPKGIVHSHGGIVVEHLKSLGITCDVRPGDRLYFYCSTSWMVWNWMIGALLVGAAPVLYDGSPTRPDVLGSWRVAEVTGATAFGTGAAYLTATERAGARPATTLDLSALRLVISTGSPLPVSTWEWVHDEFGDAVRLDSSTGGTDVCGSFVAGQSWLPVLLGELSAPCLGVAVAAYDEAGRPVVGTMGELVVTEPMPSMPIAFWADPDGSAYRAAYFDRFPGVWRHGDWIEITERGSVRVHGRSDATLNRGGVRIGSADLYGVVDVLPGVRDSLVVGIELPDGGYYLPLFVTLAPGADADAVRESITATIRAQLSRRHVPDEVVVVPGIPRTRTGKKIEVPVKRLLQGFPQDTAVAASSLTDAGWLAWFEDFGRSRVRPLIHPGAPESSGTGAVAPASGQSRGADQCV